MIYTPPTTSPAEPEPRAGCDRCAEFAEQRTQAQARRDPSAETDCNVLMRRHIEEAHA
ncbi:hypothetical protein ACGF4C_30620 [Streptomyces sp. NPDC048197]|uniref:hypothetical protein n=1 Tax=Streptomyces sp. NPDC048197 TaxID=3365511 RepID=UPI0037134950